MDQRDWTEEQQYLNHVQDVLEVLRADAEDMAGRRLHELVEHRRYMWENVGHDAANKEIRVLQAQHVADLAGQEREHELYQTVIVHYDRIQHSPFFGRMDFREQGEADAEHIYIGIATVREPKELGLLVYDWRAPVCSMYYDFTPGTAEYESPEGPVSGSMTLKRQYKIIRRTIESMFDTDLRIGDDVLQSLLAKHADAKMSSIVSTIQREQNQAIRNTSHKVFVVQGPAGSGKTSIALQRVAYLLYTHRKHITADNIVLFAPNEIFQDYVSNVLPELGESNMLQETFLEYAPRILGTRVNFEDLYSHLEHLLLQDVPEPALKASAVAFKLSRAFYELMHRYVVELGKFGIPFADIKYHGKTVVRAEAMASLFYGSLKRYRLPARFQHLTSHVNKMFMKLEARLQEQFEQKLLAKDNYVGTDDEIHNLSRRQAAKNVGEMRSAYEKMLRDLPVRLYQQLFQDDAMWNKVSAGLSFPDNIDAIRQFTQSSFLNSGSVPYEDSAPLLYLYATVLGPALKQDIRQVLIDEAQDYTWLQYETFRILFPRAGFTILGDLNQSIHPFMNRDEFHDVAELFGHDQVALTKLTKSYRSTREIMQFAQRVLGEETTTEAIRMSGEPPRLLRVRVEDIQEALEAEVREYQKLGASSIAVICRTAADAEQMHRGLAEQLDAKLLTKADQKYQTGVVVVPSYLAKGLEFDAVIVPNAECYRSIEKRLFYTACTRALHHLSVISAADAEILAGLPAMTSE